MNVSLNENTIALKRGYWQSQVKAWEESGLKQEEYCVKSGIRYSTFVYWRGILLKENISKEKDKFVAVKIEKPKSSHSESSPRSIQVKLVSGHVVYIPTTLPIAEIGQLIRTLEHAHA